MTGRGGVIFDATTDFGNHCSTLRFAKYVVKSILRNPVETEFKHEGEEE